MQESFQERHIIKYFAPGWFAVIMGTGGFANIIYLWGNSFPSMKIAGTSLALATDILYFLVLIPWLLRWFLYFPYAHRDLQHPITGNFYVTMPVATTILGTNFFIIWSNYLSSTVTYLITSFTWIVAIVGVTFFTFYTTFRMMKVEISPKPETMNFSWIMAPIANMAVLLIGNPVLNQTIKFYPDKALTVLLLNLVLLGIGFFLFIFISAIIFVRLAQYSLPPAETTPSFGIFLSAVGLAVSAIIDSAKNALSMGLLVSTDLSFLSATVIWGFGFWIVGIVIIICIYQTAKGGIPFSLGWWAFIFPLAAYTLSSLKVSVIFNTPFSLGYTAFLSILLFVLWLYTIINTIKGIKSGILFAGFPINKR